MAAFLGGGNSGDGDSDDDDGGGGSTGGITLLGLLAFGLYRGWRWSRVKPAGTDLGVIRERSRGQD
jgi:hypothetical protein